MLSTKNTFPMTDVKREFAKFLNQLHRSQEELLITKDGKAAGVLMSAETYDSLMETLEILSDRALLHKLKKSQADKRQRRIYTHDEVFKA